MWRDFVSEFLFDDSPSKALLRSALERHHRARRCRAIIDREGETIRDKWGQVKVHPLLAAERDALAGFLAYMRALNLDLGAAP